MAEITVLGTRMNGGWFAIAYDIHVRYGYEAMLSLFDRFVSQFQVRVDIIAKATMAGCTHTTVWQRTSRNKAKPLADMDELKEECGEIAVGGLVMALDGIQAYISLSNQTSIVTIQIPGEQYSEEVSVQLDSIASFFQASLLPRS